MTASARGTPVLLGIPLDFNSSYLQGAAEAPPLIRDAFGSDSSNSWSETGVDLGVEGVFTDAGDMAIPDNGAFDTIEKEIGLILGHNERPICLGGDHSITYPIVRALGKKYPELTVVHFDAHSDLYDEFQGNRYSHACPFARIMEESCAKRLIQLGIRTSNQTLREQASRFGVEIYEMRSLPVLDRLKLSGPVYISFDLDVLDPAYAPGVSHREPGGMSVRDVIAHIHAIAGDLVGADRVEYNPRMDVAQLTAMVCGRILKELLGVMLKA